MLNSLVSFLALAGVSAAWKTPDPSKASKSWNVDNFKNLVVFGDSYSDESRLSYFINSKGVPPPVGYVSPESFSAADGGRVWGRYVVQYTGANKNGQFVPAITLYDYAVSGAVTSNKETPRFFSAINAPFPDIEGYEVPAYLADKAFVNKTTGKPYFQPAINAANTVAAFFIGTNDLGVGAYLTDSQVPGNTVVSYIDAVYAQVDKVYASGIRNFVLFNTWILDLAPIYANASFGGGVPDQYWPDRPSNLTAISLRIGELVASANEAYEYRTPYEVLLARRYPGANFANFNVHDWALNVYDHPGQYLNGTAPLNVTGTVHTCANVNCTTFTTQSSPDSYFWYDSLHPSEQTERQLAREFIKVLGGQSSYAKYYSG